MLELRDCKFIGLPGIDKLNINLSNMTTLTGPNGTGKSSILRILDFAFRILDEREVCAKLPLHERWHVFQTAELRFYSQDPIDAGILGEVQSILVIIECDEQNYNVSEIHNGNVLIRIEKPVVISEIINWENLVKQANQQVSALEQEANSQPGHMRDRMILDQKGARAAAEQQRVAHTKNIDDNKMLSLTLTEHELSKKSELARKEFNEILSKLNFPSAKLITTEQLLKQNIPLLVDNLVTLKKGNKASFKEFRKNEERLNELLQSEIDISEIGNRQSLLINGIPYEKASTGTYLTLSFFALTESEDRNRIVLWDEPENGLHPTRRIQLLELMRADGRQFVIATHATEFAPILHTNSKVYRCFNNYDEESSSLKFSVVEVASRRDAFMTLDALGIHPARTLFTSNIVIWVEGPTELIFYRHWLNRRLEKDGYQEGLHYSFMQYGGSLLSYLEVADQLQLKSTIDLLSHCRHPVVLVDSDLKEAPVDTLEACLKPGARRIAHEIQELNRERAGAAIFKATQGREIENYLPKTAIWYAIENLWKEFSAVKDRLPLDALELSKYCKYPEAIEKFFSEHRIVDGSGQPKGRTIWGAANKVAMMTAALSMPNFNESDLQFNCNDDLKEIEIFIRSKHTVTYPSGIANSTR